MVELHGVLHAIDLKPVGAFPSCIHLIDDALRNNTFPVQRISRCIKVQLVHNLHVLLGIQRGRTLGGVAPSDISVVRSLNLTNLSLLGGHQNHTVGSTGTIDGSRGGVLQHVDALDVSGVQTVQTVVGCSCRDTVDDQQWRRSTHGTHTTNVHLEALTRLC